MRARKNRASQLEAEKTAAKPAATLRREPAAPLVLVLTTACSTAAHATMHLLDYITGQPPSQCVPLPPTESRRELARPHHLSMRSSPAAATARSTTRSSRPSACVFTFLDLCHSRPRLG